MVTQQESRVMLSQYDHAVIKDLCYEEVDYSCAAVLLYHLQKIMCKLGQAGFDTKIATRRITWEKGNYVFVYEFEVATYHPVFKELKEELRMELSHPFGEVSFVDREASKGFLILLADILNKMDFNPNTGVYYIK